MFARLPATDSFWMNGIYLRGPRVQKGWMGRPWCSPRDGLAMPVLHANLPTKVRSTRSSEGEKRPGRKDGRQAKLEVKTIGWIARELAGRPWPKAEDLGIGHPSAIFCDHEDASWPPWTNMHCRCHRLEEWGPAARSERSPEGARCCSGPAAMATGHWPVSFGTGRYQERCVL